MYAAPSRRCSRRVLVDCGGAASMSDATRKLSQSAVKVIDGGAQSSTDFVCRFEARLDGGGVDTVQVGKRFAIERPHVSIEPDGSARRPAEP